MTIQQILAAQAHRPWPLPMSKWSYYQEWNNALFLHWKVNTADLAALLPPGAQVDVFEGQAWVSLVAFTMQQIRPANLPALSFISDFHEINLRTYVINHQKPGVYFLNIEGGKPVSVWTARTLSGLPYENAGMKRQTMSDLHRYTSVNKNKDFRLSVDWTIGKEITHKTPLDRWLTERYCLYLDTKGKLHRYEVHHPEWALYEVNIQQLDVQYKVGNLYLQGQPDLVQYSPGVPVIAWNRQLAL